MTEQRTRGYRDFVPNRYRDFVPAPMSNPKPGDFVIGNAIRPTMVVGDDGSMRAKG
jgi:hypothetical protein